VRFRDDTAPSTPTGAVTTRAVAAAAAIGTTSIAATAIIGLLKKKRFEDPLRIWSGRKSGPRGRRRSTVIRVRTEIELGGDHKKRSRICVGSAWVMCARVLRPALTDFISLVLGEYTDVLTVDGGQREAR
jgi:hypothetical protein